MDSYTDPPREQLGTVVVEGHSWGADITNGTGHNSYLGSRTMDPRPGAQTTVGGVTFRVEQVEGDGTVVVSSSRTLSPHENGGTNMREKSREHRILAGSSIQLATPSFDAGTTFTLTRKGPAPSSTPH